MPKRKHVFISHHHGDDAHVDKFAGMMKRNGHDVRNSSVRMKPANQRRVERGKVKDETIKRLLRMKMRWASTVVVLVGEKTHTRKWVNWEIEQAHKLGKRIVGVYLRGGSAVNVPQALNDYGHALVKWNPSSIEGAVEGRINRFETPGGELRQPVHSGANSQC
ncbi:TIR domain-containing protein [Phaeobacter sp. HF9A]|uniref:TIR domain-containing protein n=1 Tax=Phaeobacter sp. HF9A TaxID=2721561 RepID=UPI0014318284|nr:TIR domain-containing protein [Phaeobacter sp. HF9A]NIZ14072.1 TIR domain-containing protein [Phaeobacter sp. HF9A]